MRFVFLMLWAAGWAVCAGADEAGLQGLQFFESKIRPILVGRCYECHSGAAKKLKGGLYLDSAEGVARGGESGAVVVAGAPAKSKLIEAVGYANVDLQMPPKDKLNDGQIADLKHWVKMGAPMPKGDAAKVAAKEEFDLAKRKAAHWAWKPVQPQTPPMVKDQKWPRSEVDRFVLAKLEEKGLSPAPEADRRTLIRRVYFDLTGLPPTPAEVEAFVNDLAGDSFEKVVDHLLASPRFGERWGRHWLDLVRYAETLGHEFDFPIPHAWRYRDYVIQSFNDDVPYDRFVMEHVAGDLLKDEGGKKKLEVRSEKREGPSSVVRGPLSVAAHGTSSTTDNGPRTTDKQLTIDHGQWTRSVIGTAFYFLGEGTHSPVDVRQNQADTMDNRIDVLGKTFLGLTVACARCHDHKFDAISTADYYAMYGYLKSTRYTQAAVNELEIESAARDLAKVKGQLRREVARAWMVKADALAEALRKDEGEGSGFGVQGSGKAKDEGGRMKDEGEAGTAKVIGGAVESWRREGAAFEVCRAGDFVVGAGKRAVEKVMGGGGVHSGLLSNKLEGAARSGTFTIDAKYLNIRAAGHGSRINVVIDNFTIIRSPIYGGLKHDINLDKPVWMSFDVEMWRGHEAYVEVMDTSVSDPGGPGAAKEGWACVERMEASNDSRKGERKPPAASAKPRAAGDRRAVGEKSGDGKLAAEKSVDAKAAESKVKVREAIAHFGEGKLGDGAQASERVAILNWGIEKGLLDGVDPAVAEALAKYREAEAKLPAPVYVPAAADGDGVDEKVFIRGSPKNLGPAVQRRFLEALGGEQKLEVRSEKREGQSSVVSGPLSVDASDGAATADNGQRTTDTTHNRQLSLGSGRLELARRIADPANPLTARVMVNRIWHHLFGRGIVASVDNVGVLGERPSHPELLDYLAGRFVKESWSVKKMIRSIVLSSAYRMSSRGDESADQLDPSNILLHRMNVRRMEGEAIRDTMLYLSGRLDETMGGPSVAVHLTPFMEGRGSPGRSGPIDGAGRRSIYIEVRRNFLPPMLLAFDTPIPFNTMGRRSVSNVPAQALILMNDPFVAEQAKLWGAKIARREGTAAHRVNVMYMEAFARPATEKETAVVLEFIEKQGEELGIAKEKRASDARVWADVAHALMNAKEFVFVE